MHGEGGGGTVPGPPFEALPAVAGDPGRIGMRSNSAANSAPLCAMADALPPASGAACGCDCWRPNVVSISGTMKHSEASPSDNLVISSRMWMRVVGLLDVFCINSRC